MSGRLGIDVGGTFTDAVFLDEASRLHLAKVPSTPNDISQAFLAGLEGVLAAAAHRPDQVSYLVHGSTVAANAIVQGKTARVGLLTTRGHRDVIEIGTQQRPRLYDLNFPKPAPIVPRELRLEVRERIGPDGAIVQPLEPRDVAAAARAFKAARVSSVAVCFLFSFVNPAHEVEAGRLLRQLLPGLAITLSCEVAPEIREYHRFATTALNAALLPVAGIYVDDLAKRLEAAGVRAPLHLMQSNGGVALARIAARLPVGLVASGPAAGVIGATRLAALSGDLDILTFDMGGTTADVALVVGGEPQFRFRGEALGHPLILPQVDVLSVGAGSGSIARVDRFGSLSVGPESAGADPGPVAYGRGGQHPTVTDAHITLGTLDPRSFLGGSIRLDAEGARAAIQEQVGAPLGLGAEQAAAAILRVANATMVRALRVISVARGQDPRRFSLSAFGGAGPLHACAIADELGIRRVLVPRHPGVTSALGLLLADVRHDLRQSWVRVTSRIKPGELERRLAAMEGQAQELLGSSGLSNGDGRIEIAVDMRYRGQAYELTVPMRRGNAARTLSMLDRDFHNAHRQAYGHARPVDETELVTLRVRALGPVPAVAEVGGHTVASRDRGAAGRRQAWLEGGPVDCAVYDRASLPVGAQMSGPAILEQYDSTVLVAPGWRLSVGVGGNAVLERE